MGLCATLAAPRRILLENRAAQPLPRGGARIAVAFAGVCGTDLALWKGDYPVPLPLVLGHEFSGRVVEVGQGSDGSWLGRRVTAEINNTCLSWADPSPCEACRRGLDRHCQKRTVTGIVRWDGAFAREVTVPMNNLHAIPDSIPDQEAVFVEPLAAALQTFEMGPLGVVGRDGNPLDGPPWVAVLGVGRLGLFVAAVAKAMGARVIGIARSAERLNRAAPYCEILIQSESEDLVIRQVLGVTSGLGADYVVEATASPQGLALAGRLTRPRGTIAMKSTPGLPVERLDLTKFVVDELRLQGSRCGPFDKAIDFIVARSLDLASLIGEVVPLDRVEKALQAAETRSKVLLQCAR